MRANRYSEVGRRSRPQPPESGGGTRNPARHLPLFLTLVAASLGLIAVDLRYGFDWLTEFTGRLASPVSTGLDQAVRPFSSTADRIRETLAAREENADLRQRVADLERENLALQKSEQENLRLRELLNLKAETAPSAMAAQVMRFLDAPRIKALVLRAGADQGIRVGQPVLSDSSQLLGRVVEVGPGSSSVRLLTDPVSKVRVTLERTGAQGTLYSQRGELRVRMERGESVREGDRILTSHLSTIFPEGLTVGVVAGEDSDVEGDSMVAVEMGLMRNYRVEGALPVSRWAGVREVLCLPVFRQTLLEKGGEE